MDFRLHVLLPVCLLISLFEPNGLYAQTAEEYKKQAVIKADAKDYAGAIEDFTTALLLNPRDTNTYFDRAMMREYRGDLLGAIEDFTSAADLDPENADNFYLRGLVKERMNNIAGAVNDLEKALQLEPENADAEYHLALCQLVQNKAEEARKHLNKAISLNPDHAEAYAARGHLSIADKTVAMNDLEKAIHADPSLAISYKYMAELQINAGDPWKATPFLIGYCEKMKAPVDTLSLTTGQRKNLCKTISKFEKDSAVKKNIPKYTFGVLYLLAGVPKKAIASFRAAQSEKNTDALFYYYYGLAEERSGHLNKAILLFEKAAQANKELMDARVHTAVLKERSKDVAGAQKELSFALQIFPYNAYLFWLRGSLLVRSGSKKAGCEDVQKALSLGITFLINDANSICR